MIQSLNRPADDVSVISKHQKKKEEKLYSLRVTNTTVILVLKSKFNQEYAEQYRREKMGLNY